MGLFFGFGILRVQFLVFQNPVRLEKREKFASDKKFCICCYLY
jgi:hypothetical protein